MNKFNWNFKAFFESDNEFEKELSQFEKDIEKFKKRFENLSLYDLLKKYYDLALKSEKLVSYAELNSDLDMSNQKYMSYKNLVSNKKVELDLIRADINKKILLIDESLEEYPELKEYKMHLYEVLRLKEHTKEDRNIQNLNTMISRINDLYNTIQNVELEYKMVTIKGKKVIINSKEYGKNLLNVDNVIRKKVFNTFTDSLAKVNKSISNLLDMRLKNCCDVAIQKGYNSILEQTLNDDDLNIEIINNLINSVNKNFSLLKKYFDLKKKNLNLKKLTPYDLKLSNSYNKKISFEESLETVRKSLSIMGNEYSEVLEKVLEEGCLDVYSKENKFLGGYHWRNYTKPMILMNYSNSLKSTYIVAHELGHAVNGLMIKNNQTFQDFHFSVFLSETASKVNENILDEYLIKKAITKEEKQYLLEQKLTNFVESVFFQTMFLEFEMQLCKIIEGGNPINADIINDTFYTLYKKYYPGIKENEKVKYLWQTRIHLFYGQYRYYNFQYATGYLGALKISNDIVNSKNNMLNKYLNFLKIGGSKPTLESLRTTGVDYNNISIYNESMEYFSNLLNEYETILNNK